MDESSTSEVPRATTVKCSRVEVVSRSQWGALHPQSEEKLNGPARRVVIHHTALWACDKPQTNQAQLIHIQNMHMQERHFHDIGYNFLIGGDGTLYEGRGWGIVGAHAKGHNFDSVGIALMGNFNNGSPSSAALSSIKRLLQRGVAEDHLHPAFALFGHRDLANTECPGDRLYSALQCLKSQ